MASRLADETLQAILEPILNVSDDEFSDTLRTSPFAARESSTADILLVCKRWMRVATPLLYATVVLRSIAQAQALARTLKEYPEFASYVRKIRIEGGFGVSVGKVLRAATQVTDLYLGLELNSKDNVKSMCDALSFINPTRFIFSEPPVLTACAAATLDSLKKALPSWSNLRMLVFPWTILHRDWQRRMLESWLSDAAHISEIHVRGFRNSVFISPGDTIFTKWPHCKVHVYAQEIERDPRPVFLEQNAERVVVHHDQKNIGSSFPVMRLPSSSECESEPVMHRAPASVQRQIWTAILSYVLARHFPRSSPFRSLADDFGWPWMTRSYMGVSKLFMEICTFFALKRVCIGNPGMAEDFEHLLHRRPELQSHVYSLSIPYPESYGYPLRIIALAPALRRIQCIISLSDITALSSAAGATVEEAVLTISPPHEDKEDARASFCFPALRRLDLRVSHVSLEDLEALHLDVPLLEDLVLDERQRAGLYRSSDYDLEQVGWVYSLVATVRLPNLRFLSFHTLRARISRPIRALLTAHGASCLDIMASSENVQDILELCPSLQNLQLNDSWMEHFELLELDSPHNNLTKLTLHTLGLPQPGRKGTRKQMDEITEYFQTRFDARLFPALREIVGGHISWPTVPHDIPGNPLALWAEILQEKGIKLTDRKGRGWRPRMKASTRG